MVLLIIFASIFGAVMGMTVTCMIVAAAESDRHMEEIMRKRKMEGDRNDE